MKSFASKQISALSSVTMHARVAKMVNEEFPISSDNLIERVTELLHKRKEVICGGIVDSGLTFINKLIHIFEPRVIKFLFLHPDFSEPSEVYRKLLRDSPVPSTFSCKLQEARRHPNHS